MQFLPRLKHVGFLAHFFMKAYTDISQSKRLAEILPLESADMYWDYDVQKHEDYPMVMDEQFDDTCIRAWSLAALLNILPVSIYDNTDEYSQLEFSKISVAYHDINDGIKVGSIKDNLVDACYELILKLHKLNLL